MHRLVLLLAPALLAGCAISPTPNYDARFGDAVRAGPPGPDAQPAARRGSVQGMDGVAAKHAPTATRTPSGKPPRR